MIKRMPGYFEDTKDYSQKRDFLTVLDVICQTRDPVIVRTKYPDIWEVFAQGQDATGVIRVVMGDQYVGQMRTLPLQGFQHHFGIPRIDNDRFGLVRQSEHPDVIVLEGLEGRDLKIHGI